MSKHFRTGDCVTYVDLFNATVIGMNGGLVTIVMVGRGTVIGTPVITSVEPQWLDYGWKAQEETPNRRTTDKGE